MQQPIDYATTAVAFKQTVSTDHPELLIGVLPGMLDTLCWVFRDHAYFAPCQGNAKEITEAFGRVPLASLEQEVMHRLPIDTNWPIKELSVRQYPGSNLQRVVANGYHGESTILLEASHFPLDQVAAQSAAIRGRLLHDVLAGRKDAHGSPSRRSATGAA